MKKTKKIFLTTSLLMLPSLTFPIISCSENKELPNVEGYDKNHGIYFMGNGTIIDVDDKLRSQQEVIIPEYLEVTSPKTSPIYGKKIRIKELNPYASAIMRGKLFRYLERDDRDRPEESKILSYIELPNSIETISYDTFKNANLDDRLVWPKELRIINKTAFFGNLFVNLDLSNTLLEYIFIGAFSGCSKLSTIKFPKTLKYVDSLSFKNTNLKKVELPKNCRYEKNAFPPDCEVVGGILVSE